MTSRDGFRDDDSLRINDERDHEVVVTNRRDMFITGVLGVDSFDDLEICLQTDMGTLTIRGEDLHVEEISLDTGEFRCCGKVTGFQYSARSGGRRGDRESWLQRILH